jgi:hypothetical protein
MNINRKRMMIHEASPDQPLLFPVMAARSAALILSEKDIIKVLLSFKIFHGHGLYIQLITM